MLRLWVTFLPNIIVRRLAPTFYFKASGWVLPTPEETPLPYTFHLLGDLAQGRGAPTTPLGDSPRGCPFICLAQRVGTK